MNRRSERDVGLNDAERKLRVIENVRESKRVGANNVTARTKVFCAMIIARCGAGRLNGVGSSRTYPLVNTPLLIVHGAHGGGEVDRPLPPCPTL